MSPHIVLAISLLVPASAFGSPTSTTTWVSQKQDPTLWSRVTNVLSAELAPDDPTLIAPHYVALRYKYLDRVATIDDVALVLMRMRERKNDVPRYDVFAAYSVELKSGSIHLLGKFVFWHFVRWARLERGAAPDALFRYDSCYECEAQTFLASFSFDEMQRIWKIREWPEDGPKILVRADNEPDEEFYTTCVFGVRDFTNDGIDDIATWCREVNVKTKKTTTAHTIYTVSSAGSERRTVASTDARRLEMELCRQNPRAALCK
jgi:hypothetical protein